MQVKKFEATSMKEALELIKNQLGPEAIILSVKDRKTPMARGGGTIFEVTAAVSDTTLRRKIAAEKKLGSKELERFNRSSARVQKEFINKVFNQPAPKIEVPQAARPLTTRRYIEIDDSEFSQSNAKEANQTPTAQQRIKMAAESARIAAQGSLISDSRSKTGITGTSAISVGATQSANVTPASTSAPRELLTLKNEIGELKKVIEELQGVRANKTSLHPGAELGINFELSPVYEKLQRAGLSRDWIGASLVKAQANLPASQSRNRSIVEGYLARLLLEETEIAKSPLASRYHVFVGPSGQGKTSSLVKLASYLVLTAKKRVAIATVDRFKVGASDQLRTFAQILNIPYAEITRAEDWTAVDQKLGHIDFILVDFPGAALKSQREVELLQPLLPPTNGGRSIHLVMSVLNKDEDAFEIAQRYGAIGIRDVIFTKLDESIQHGLIFNFITKFRWPLFGFGTGPQIPEDFEWATKERVLNLIFRIQDTNTDVKSSEMRSPDREESQS